jgi:hypothetical protein
MSPSERHLARAAHPFALAVRQARELRRHCAAVWSNGGAGGTCQAEQRWMLSVRVIQSYI